MQMVDMVHMLDNCFLMTKLLFKQVRIHFAHILLMQVTLSD